MPSPDTLRAVADLGVGAALRAGPLTAEQIDAVQAYIDPATAGYLLAELITRLPDEMLTLIGGDQITDKAILGCPVPEPARPILRAIDDRHEPVLDSLVWATPKWLRIRRPRRISCGGTRMAAPRPQRTNPI